MRKTIPFAIFDENTLFLIGFGICILSGTINYLLYESLKTRFQIRNQRIIEGLENLKKRSTAT